MGFPLVMYLSQSSVVALTSNKPARSTWGIEKIAAAFELSLSPKLTVEMDWAKIRNKAANPGEPDWPPENSMGIAAALDELLTASGEVGSLDDLLSGRKCEAYRLTGFIKYSDKRRKRGPSERDGLRMRIELCEADMVCDLLLSRNNIAGVSLSGKEWRVWESGARFFFEIAGDTGFPAGGLFTLEGEGSDGRKLLRSIYFVSATKAAQPNWLYLREWLARFNWPVVEASRRRKMSLPKNESS